MQLPKLCSHSKVMPLSEVDQPGLLPSSIISATMNCVFLFKWIAILNKGHSAYQIRLYY